MAESPLWRIEKADAIDFLRGLPEGSVDLLFTSPPYAQQRAYLEDGQDLGIARGPDEWVSWMLEVCHAARYACKGLCAFVVEGKTTRYRYDCTPFLLMADLHKAGFHLRKPCVYKRYGIPGSGGPDWLRNDWEPVVCFTRGKRLPWSDPTACGRPPKYEPGGMMSNRHQDGVRKNARVSARAKQRAGTCTGPRTRDGLREPRDYIPPDLANPGNVIDVGAAGGRNLGSPLAHLNEAPFPEMLAEFFVRTFCPPGGTVCDCFAGSGTTLAVALRCGRRASGCDLRQSQVDLTRRRLLGETPPLFPV